MSTQPHTEQPPQSETEQGKRKDAMNFNVKANRALRDLDGLLLAALCVIRMEEAYTDTSDEDKKQGLETLLEHARGALADADEGLEGVWRITAGYIWGSKRDAPDTVSDTVQPEGEA